MIDLARPVDFRQQSVDLSPLAGIGLAYAGQQQRQSQQDQQQALIQQAQEVASSGDTNAMRDFAIANPEIGKTMFEVGGIIDEQAQNRMTNLTKSLVSSPSPVNDLKMYIEQGRQTGRDMTHSEKLLQQSGGDDGQLRKITEASLAFSDPQGFNAYQKTKSGTSTGAPSSVKETEWFLSQPKDIQDKHLELKWKKDPTLAAKLEQKQAESDIKISEEKTKSRLANRNTAVNAAVAKGSAIFDKIQPLATAIGNYDEAISSIDSGAASGNFMSYIPSFKKSSIELDNIVKRLGLDVVGNTTFGALSESELAFALSAAAPTNLQPKELRDWFIKKRDAQKKVKERVEEAATFLSSGQNSIADWVDYNAEKQTESTPLSDEDLIKKYGG